MQRVFFGFEKFFIDLFLNINKMSSMKITLLNKKINQSLFWGKIIRQDLTISMCWPYHGAKNTGGYGVFYCGNDSETWDKTGKCAIGILSHRVAFYLYNKYIDESLEIMHTCDNKACCNPAHLKQATHKENVADFHEKVLAGKLPKRRRKI